MTRRIRKKRLDAINRHLADGLRLYAAHRRGGRDAAKWEAIARSLLELSIGLAIRERLQVLPGPRRGCEVDPPTGVTVEMPDAVTIRARGDVVIRDRQGEGVLATETFRVLAHRQRGIWRTTLMTLGSGTDEPVPLAG